MTPSSIRPARLLLALVLAGCNVAGTGPQSGPDAGASTDDEYHGDKIAYRDLDSHPGCSTADLSYPAASIPGYPCAAKLYPFPDGVSEDTSKPIVILVHGNSDSPSAWERYPADSGNPMLAEQLVAAGYRTIAVDLRIDLVDDPQENNETQNAARNIDHGWSVPIVQALIGAVLEDYPDRKISLVGFSLGVTVIRDALRRLHEESEVSPFARIDQIVHLAGANHGVSTSGLCSTNPTMRGRVTCEMGSRDNYSPTEFMKPLNGPGGAYETPCSDGDSAFGEYGVCGGNTVHHTTVVMRDISDGTYQDLFVSEASARLAGADNRLLSLEDTDDTGYFWALFVNHYGSSRSAAALGIVMDKIAD